MKLKKWIFIAVLLVILYYTFIVNTLLTLSVIAAFIVAFKLYKFYARKKLNKLSDSKELFRQSELGHFIALVAKVAKADGRVHELEAQLIGMMFDDISKLFDKKEKARAIMKEIFNDEKQTIDDTSEITKSLNKLLGRSILKRKQYISFLIQLAFIDNGISMEEERLLRQIVNDLNISSEAYDSILNSFKNKMKNTQQSMSESEAYKVLGVKEDDDINTIKKAYRKLIRKYHPDIISSQEKDESYMEEATAKTQEINQAYQIIKDIKKI
ncbi:molecular chaperone DjlA [Halarcobacter mediterraneus]|uniref:Molecular chaperone DjlA n=1 Tax=Halarcobacter mediterraneus TaxID=2023153 RepID=A0A4Q1B1E9_9BACT|nr:DnaJ domain-containing protein [Halarcobacter mediterraneus]RXK12327.1 molecular chaperone DjlA [Halarcobacter mediterraneus]